MWELKDCHRSTGDHHQSYSKVTGCRGNKTLTFCDGGYLTIERALRSQMFITGIMKGRELGVGLLMQAHEQAGLRPLFAPWSKATLSDLHSFLFTTHMVHPTPNLE